MRIGVTFLLFCVCALFTGCAHRESLRIATYNAYLLSPTFRCAAVGDVAPDCTDQIVGITEGWAVDLAATIIKNADQIDVLALNEVWDEDARKILVDTLAPHYQAIVTKIDSSIFSLDPGFPLPPWFVLSAHGEDSGLMLFAKHEFLVDPLPNPAFRWGSGPAQALKASTSEVAFVRFGDCKREDCLAAKGAALVRLRNGKDGPIYNVVFGHLQADYPKKNSINESTRDGQFRDIESLIRGTLPNLEQRLLDGEQVILMGDLNVPFLLPSPPLEWTRRFLDVTSLFGDPLFETWGPGGSFLDRTETNSNDHERFDYIVATRGSLTPATTNSRFPCVQHVTVPVAFASLQSDHNMVHADINRGFWHCNPVSAYQLPLPATPGTERIIQMSANGSEDITRIVTPGAMQWFEVSVEAGGKATYSIGVDNPSQVRVDIFLPEDMTTPLAPYYELPSTTPALAKRQPYTVWQYFLPRHFYIRTRGSSRSTKANYSLFIRRHACESKIDACLLQPDQLATAELSASYEPTQLVPQDEAWFRFDAKGAASSGAPQTLKLTAAIHDEQRVSESLVDYVDPLAGPPMGKTTMTNIVEYSGAVGAGGHGYFVAKQSSRAPQRTPIAVAFDSNLRFLKVDQLICGDETDLELGSDEIFSEFKVDGVTQRVPSSGDVEFECDNNDDPHPWGPYFPDSRIAYLNDVGIRIQEGDTSEDDESTFQSVPTLTPGTYWVGGRLWWTFDGGEYKLDIQVMRRPNESVAEKP